MLKICAVGDIMLGEGPYYLDRGIATRYRKIGDDIFSDVHKFLQGDIIFGNLEVPLSKYSEAKGLKSKTFRGDPESIALLKDAGFNVINLANNHFLSHGYKAAVETYNLLIENKITPIGWNPNFRCNELCYNIFDINNIIVGFIPLCNIPTTMASGYRVLHFPNIYSNCLDNLIIKLRNECDILIISVHWGREYIHQVSPDIKKFSRKWQDMGINLILGHGPHVLQGCENNGKSLVVYSMGNFLFDQLFMDKTRIGGIFNINYENNDFNYTLYPTQITSQFSITSLNGSDKQKWINFYKSLCNELIYSTTIISQSEYDTLADKEYFEMQKNNLKYIFKHLNELTIRSSRALIRDGIPRLKRLLLNNI